jgi:hypothetical protein
MIEKDLVLTVRENGHKIVDTLPEDCLSEVLDFPNDLRDGKQSSLETKVAIEEGLNDIRNGRTITPAE